MLPPEHSMHFARIALIGLSGCPRSRRSCNGIERGNLPTFLARSVAANRQFEIFAHSTAFVGISLSNFISFSPVNLWG